MKPQERSREAFGRHTGKGLGTDPQSPIWTTPTPWIWRHGYEAAISDFDESDRQFAALRQLIFSAGGRIDYGNDGLPTAIRFLDWQQEIPRPQEQGR